MTGTAVSTPVVVGSRLGLHARPAALIARAVAALEATVRISKGEAGPVDAASALMLIALGAKCGEEVVVHADGPNAGEALARICEMVARDLDAEDGDAG